MDQTILCTLAITRSCMHREDVHYSGPRNGKHIDLFIEKEAEKLCDKCKGANDVR